jgi:hypothetical protein
MTTVDYVAFLNTTRDCEISSKLYADATAVRISLESAAKTCLSLPSGPKRWVDAAIDGLHQKNLSQLTGTYVTHVKQFPGYAQMPILTFNLLLISKWFSGLSMLRSMLVQRERRIG